MKLSDFQKVKELIELREAYRTQSQLISERCLAHLVVTVRGGSEKKTQPASYIVQDMLCQALKGIDAQLTELGVKL